MSEQLQYVARIFVPTSGDRGNNGTAYPIAPNRVITAAHVLKDERDGKTIWHDRAEVLWNQHEATANLDWQPATVKWNGHNEGFDIAVLETMIPPQFNRYAEASWTSPPIGREFHLRGFAAVGKRGDDREAVSFLGKSLAHLPIDEEIPIGVFFAPEIEAGWQGASGSPVIIDNKLFAVIVNCPFGIASSQVRAISIHKLIRNLGFLKETGLSAEQIAEDRCRVAKSEIAAILKEQNVYTGGLIHRLKERGYADETLDTTTEQERVETVAAIILAPDLRTKVVLEVLGPTRSSLTHSAAAAILRIIRLVLPIKAAATPSLQLRVEAGDILSLDAVSQTMAELALARLEGRKASFAARDESDNLRGGTRGLSRKEFFAPEAGQETTPHEMGNATIRHLVSKVSVADPETWQIRPLIQHEARNLRDWDALTEILKKRLRKFRNQGGSVYFAYTKLEDQEVGGKLDAIAKEVKRQIPEFVFVRLSGDDKTYVAEYEEFETLSELLDELMAFGQVS
jgi:hypothetical protein